MTETQEQFLADLQREDDIYNSLSARLREGLAGSYKAMGIGAFSNPSSLESRDLLILILINARQAAKAATHVLRGAES